MAEKHTVVIGSICITTQQFKLQTNKQQGTEIIRLASVEDLRSLACSLVQTQKAPSFLSLLSAVGKLSASSAL